MLKKSIFVVLALLLLVGASQQSQAALNAVAPGPYNNAAIGNYPEWYQDQTGTGLAPCLSFAGAPLNPMCVILNAAGAQMAPPLNFPNPWPPEAFYFLAETDPAVTNVFYRAALEAGFGGGTPLANDQMVFARIRIRVDIPAPGGTYTVTHPYGVETFTGVGPGIRAINFTRDIGLTPLLFTSALAGDIGPFLAPSATTGGPADAPIVVGAESFIGNPNVVTKITGSPFGTNFVRITGPNIGPGGVLEISDFTVSGQLFTGALPTPLTVARSSYTRGPTAAGHVDVLATSTPNAILSLNFLGAANMPAGDIPIPGNGLGSFFTAVQLPDATVLPATIQIAANLGAPAQTLATVNLVDEVIISQAVFSDVTGSLVVQASSTDKGATPPTLTVVGFGTMTPDVNGVPTLVVPGVHPPSVTVQSTAGGITTAPVQHGLAPEILRVTSATFKTKTSTWRVLGHTTRPGSMIRIFNSSNLAAPSLGAVRADADGLFRFTLKGVKGRKLPNANKRISLRSSGGDTIKNKRVGIVP